MDRNIDLIFLQTSPCVKQGFPNSSKGKRRDGGGGGVNFVKTSFCEN